MNQLQNCLSCGDPEVERVRFDFIPKLNNNDTSHYENSSAKKPQERMGWHYRDAYSSSMQKPQISVHMKQRP